MRLFKKKHKDSNSNRDVVKSYFNQCSTPSKNLYKVLGLTKDCELKDIKSAFRKLARQYHPDKNADNPEATELFQEINRAHRILSNPTMRQLYDQFGLKAAEQLGDNSPKPARWWHLLLFILLGVLTGCFCCCLVCFCCCCGKCNTELDSEVEEEV